MVNVWTWALIAGAVGIAAVLSFLLARVFKRGLRVAALGSLLVPVTGLWLWACGITAEHYQTVTRGAFSNVFAWTAVGKAGGNIVTYELPGVTWSGGRQLISAAIANAFSANGGAKPQAVITVIPTRGPMFLGETVSSSPVVSFWLGMAILGIVALLTVLVTRQAGYLAAGALVAFGVYQLLAVALFSPRAGSGAWYDWLVGMTSRATVCELAVGSVVAGLVLGRYTVVHDMLRRTTLTSRVEQLTQTRAEAVDAAAAELRRLERDLHDGAQARLVAIGLSLRALEKMIPVNPGAATALAVECREASALALADLRDLVRGIYPPVLAERGLGDAVRALALDSPGKVATDIDLPGRPPAPVEAAVYFAVAEALSNVAKHAGARQTLVRMYHDDGMLRVEVTDDGHGGADPEHGTGLAGIERRLAAFDGILALSSPVGGPGTRQSRDVGL